jgi:hypothetical protein
MKRILFFSLLFLTISPALIAIPLNASTFGLNGYYNISNWMQIPNSGFIDISGAPNSLVFTSGDENPEIPGPPDTTYISIKAPNGIIVKINWSYDTKDDMGSSWDYPVFIIDGIMHRFTSFDIYGPDLQSGIETFVVEKDQTFGFGAYTIDGYMGACTINSLSLEFDTVPVGISTILGAFLLIGFSFFWKRRSKKLKLT